MGGSLARMGFPTPVASATYNAANQLTSWDGVAHSYDTNGNLTGDTVRTLTWDSRNRLTNLAGPVAGNFSYDAMGRRKSKTVAGTGTSFLYDGLNIVQELNGASPQANLLTGQGIDEVFARTSATGSENFVTDGLGSTVALTDAAGAVQTSYTYEAYGKAEKSGTATTNSQTYTGREDDGAGLYYYRARYYNPVLGRFVSEDPIGLGGGVNSYSYVLGRPIEYSDPFGLVGDGHHIFPRQNWGEYSSEAQKMFEDMTTDTAERHGWSREHKDYNKYTKDLADDYCKKNGIDKSKMTPDQARRMVDSLADDDRVKDFLEKIAPWLRGLLRAPMLMCPACDTIMNIEGLNAPAPVEM